MKISIVGKGSLSSFLEKLCWVFFFAGLALTVALPWILNFYGRIFWHDLGADYIRILIVLYPAALMALIVVWQLRKILVNVNAGNPFSLENARRVNIVSVCCLVVGGLFLAGIVPSLMAPMLGLAFLFLAALALVLSELVKQAAIYKEENDLTI
ncbi:MAG: DUF2975 domain-containing protein [Oscillospiraceae bacterium]|nr:DUF2975 domain-containing protein [Oscillospiraceae bacterium]